MTAIAETVPAAGTKTAWKLDPAHTLVEFSAKHLMITTVKGRITDIEGVIYSDEKDLKNSSVEATLKAVSLDTRTDQRDQHLRSADFLDVERYPDILFKSIRVEAGTDRDMFNVVGELTIRDKSREIALNANAVDHSCSPQGEEVVYYTAMTVVDRFDFGITYGRGVLGRKLEIVINLQATKQSKEAGV